MTDGQITSYAKIAMLKAIFGSGDPVNIFFCALTAAPVANPTGAQVDALACGYTDYAHKQLTNNSTNFPDPALLDAVAKTSGALVVGARYYIDDFNAGDDFTNVGGENETGSSFIAAGTTPTTWTNGSTLYRMTVKMANGADFEMVEASGSTATATHFALKDTLVAGNVLAVGKFATARVYTAGITPKIKAGDLIIYWD